jgi:hypothetical protein
MFRAASSVPQRGEPGAALAVVLERHVHGCGQLGERGIKLRLGSSLELHHLTRSC